ncbi:hypothetical protein ACFY1P_05665 [Streptomyces sp. NPDC001407]|uniref:hypothetical protein n=1 Tax=unclassified Streptomyces TaxID=2593676 RepID=UPI0033EAC2AA
MRDNRSSSTRRTTRLARLSLGLALGTSAALTAATGAAHAADGPLDIPNYQAALDAVKSTTVHNTVCRFLSVPVPHGGTRGAQSIPAATDPCQGVPSFTVKDPVALYEVTPDFVAGKAKPVLTDALRLTYAVSSVSAGNGRTATVMLGATEGGGWHLAAVREGDSDATYPTKGDLGAAVFSTPQDHAWYELKLDNTVQPLNDAAKSAIDGKSSLPLADYQTLLKSRLADKQPGSDYDTKGYSSGYRAAAPAHRSSSQAPLIVGGSGAALAFIGGVFAVRRRRAARTD